MDCRRSARGSGLCPGPPPAVGHAGRPDLGGFAATTDPRWRRQRPNAGCRVAGCGYGVAAAGCVSCTPSAGHAPGDRTWRVAGRPADGQAPAGRRTCRIGTAICGRRRHCRSATPTPTPGRPTGDPRSTCSPRVRRGRGHRRRDHPARRLGPQLRWRSSTRCSAAATSATTKTSPAVVMRSSGSWPPRRRSSLLDRAEDEWRTQIGRPAPTRRQPAGAADLRPPPGRGSRATAAAGRPSTPATSGSCAALGFDRQPDRSTSTAIPQPWLRDLVKRWLRWRLGTGLGLEAVRRGLRALTRFAGFCEPHRRQPAGRRRPGAAGALPGRPARRAGRQPAPRRPHRAAQHRSSTRSASTAGTTRCRPPRCCSPRTTPNAPNGRRGRWPSRSWPRSSTPTTSPGGPTPPTGWSP